MMKNVGVILSVDNAVGHDVKRSIFSVVEMLSKVRRYSVAAGLALQDNVAVRL